MSADSIQPVDRQPGAAAAVVARATRARAPEPTQGRPPPAAPVPAPRHRQGRSRVTNGAEILPGIDGRSLTARRYHDLVAAIVADHGSVPLSETRMQLIRRFAASAVLAEAMEAKLVSGGTIDVTEHSQLSSTLVRLASRIGLDRVPKDVTPATLSDYMAQRRRELDAEQEEPDSDA